MNVHSRRVDCSFSAIFAVRPAAMTDPLERPDATRLGEDYQRGPAPQKGS